MDRLPTREEEREGESWVQQASCLPASVDVHMTLSMSALSVPLPGGWLFCMFLRSGPVYWGWVLFWQPGGPNSSVGGTLTSFLLVSQIVSRSHPRTYSWDKRSRTGMGSRWHQRLSPSLLCTFFGSVTVHVSGKTGPPSPGTEGPHPVCLEGKL